MTEGRPTTPSPAATRVLYIDDEEAARHAFRRVMRRHGFNVDVASGLAEASAHVAANSYKVVVTDYRMPEIDGLQLVEVLRPACPHASYLLLTGAGEMEIGATKERAAHIAGIIFKPWNGRELAAALHRLAADEPSPDETVARSGGPILVAARNQEFGHSLETMLAGALPDATGVIAAQTLGQMHDLLRTTHFSAAVVVMDLPDAPDVACITELVSRHPDLPLLAIAPDNDETAVARALRNGAQRALALHELSAATVRHSIHEAVRTHSSHTHLRQLAHFDPVTGLANRVFFRQLLEAALDRRDQTPGVAVLVVDLDRFAEFNEELGYAVGDHVLNEVARRLEAATSEHGSAARLGADQFAVVLPHSDNAEDASRVARRFLQAMQRPVRVEHQEFFVTASVGIAAHAAEGPGASMLLSAATAAMRRAKQAGRNRCRVHVGELSSHTARRITLESELGRALEKREFEVFYQPIIDIKQARVVGAEALLRWRNPERGLISPAAFIPPLEETGLIVQVGAWILRKAAEQVRAWSEEGLGEFRMAVNIAAVQFQEEDIHETVAQVLHDTGIAPRSLCLEITESALLEDSSSTRTSLQALRDMGVHVALDDFGTGYSSLSYLRRYPIETLKIDRSFVRDLPGDDDAAAVASAIIALAKSLRLEVVAEGIETVQQLHFLSNLGCDKYQGFLMCPPVPAAAFAEWVKEHPSTAVAA